MNRRHGFTLIELMIVIAIVAVLFAFAMPALFGSRKSGNESATIGALRTIITANNQHILRFGSYAIKFHELVDGGFIDAALGAAEDPAGKGKSGYFFAYFGTRYTWSVAASPIDPGVTGDRHFYTDHTGVLRVSSSGPATAADPPLSTGGGGGGGSPDESPELADDESAGDESADSPDDEAKKGKKGRKKKKGGS